MKKLMCFILCAVMLLITFCSCDNSNHDSSTPASSTVESESSESNKSVADVPDVDYNNEKFVILTTYTSTTITNPEFGGSDGEEYIADTINDAVFARNASVEDMLHINIEEIMIYDDGSSNPMYEAIMNDVNSGNAAYDLVRPRLIFCATLGRYGYLQDLLDLEYLHGLKEDWWYDYCNDTMKIDDKLFFAMGDISYRTIANAACIVYNKEMHSSYGLENPYELVKSNAWTMDKILEWSVLVKNDENNDGKITYEDTYGVGGQYDQIWGLFYAAGGRLAEKDDEGIPEITIYNEKNVNAVSKILELMQNKDYFVCANDYFGVAQWPGQLLTQAFVEGRNLLYFSSLAGVLSLREMKVDFGILPMPLFTDDQENYETFLYSYGAHGICISSILDDERTERASIVMEVLGAESRNIITPAYIEKALKYQQTRDDESQEMLDIIYSTVGCDIGHVYQWGNLNFKVLHALINSSANNFRSLYEANLPVAEAQLEEDLAAFNKNN